MSPPPNESLKISLHLDERVVSASAFVRGVRAFIGLIEEVSNFYGGQLKWGVTVHEGSNVVEVQSLAPSEHGVLAMQCLESLQAGLDVIESRPELPVAFSTTAIQRAKKLAVVVQQVGGHIQGPTKQVRPTSQTAANVDKLLGTPYSAIGSVEGELLLVSDVRGAQIGLRDALTGRIIHCGFGSDDLDDVATQFHKRVSVRGFMKYRADGTVASIDVETYRVLRDSAQLPSAEDVRGILREH